MEKMCQVWGSSNILKKMKIKKGEVLDGGESQKSKTQTPTFLLLPTFNVFLHINCYNNAMRACIHPFKIRKYLSWPKTKYFGTFPTPRNK